MKRILSALALVTLTLVAVNAPAVGQPAKAAAKTMTLKGEVVDLGCYLGHGARGADHKSCATECIANGMPFGLLTANAETVVVSGSVVQRNGLIAVEVADVKSAK